jgi:outer membrane protein OmpA-like peptidoglycan-associated protein/Tol biopolymer transport system component
MQHPVPFDVNQLGPAINSADDEYWPSLTVDGQILFFTRLIRRDDPAPKSNQFVQEDIFNSQLIENCWQESHPVSSLNSNENEGAQSISADGRMLFYTACNRPDGMGSCDIYYSILRSGKWSEPFNAGKPVSSVDWDAQPSFSIDGRTIYFSSNRKGGKGGMDIWKCDLLKFTANGAAIWGYPVNLGDSINTPGNEMSPFIHSDGKTLYFASNHWPGMGGSDIFHSRMLDQKTWSKARNMGYPINTFKDEMGLVVDASGANAYFSSDRPGSQGKDIYEFKLYAEARPLPVSYIKGKVFDDSTAEPLFAKIELTDLQQSKSIIQTQTDRTTGEFLIGLPLRSEYAFNISSEGYLFFSKNIIVSDMNQQIEPQLVEFRLNKIESGNSVTLNNVFFETGSAIINHQSFPELQKLLELLINNSEIKIEIEGHTDNIGNDVYNHQLSEFRAESVYNYLVEHGIDRDRLKFFGYGLSKPVSSNDTPQGRALNRRTVFRILGK